MNTFFSSSTIQTIIHHWFEKIVASISLAAIAEIMGVHIQFCLMFILLMALDILTRYLAQTAKFWQDTYKNVPFTLYDLWKFRVQSRKWRYFRSEEMRKKFVSKFFTYLIIFSASAACDTVMQISKGQPFCLMVCTAFLSLTELCSIMENLQECEVKEVKDLMAVIKKRKEGIK